MELYHPVKIGEATLSGNLFLAPLAGYTDKPFRSLAADFGASATYTEMVSVEAISRNNPKSLSLAEPFEGEKAPVIQIFGGNEEAFRKAIPLLEPYKPLFFDLNAGCPVPKIVKSGAGAMLTRYPKELEKLIKVIKKSTSFPVTVKIRSGWDSSTLTYREAALRAEDAGADAVAIHPRTKEQGYSGKADWSCIKELVEQLSIPVIGSGDLFCAQDIKKMLLQTGCRAVMIARGSIGNPGIFAQTASLLKTGREEPTLLPQEKATQALLHLNKGERFLKEARFSKEVKKHLCAYLKGLPGAVEVRRKIITEGESTAFYKEVLQEYRERLIS